MEDEPPRSHAEGSSAASPSSDDPPTATSSHADAEPHMQIGEQQPDASLGPNTLLPNGHTPSTHVTDAPPFWTARHGRSISTASYHSLNSSRPHPILLEDHSHDSHSASRGCWAHFVAITDYIVVSGPTGIGAYVVWHCTVRTLKGGDLEVQKRYSEFVALREDLVRSFPGAEAMIPRLPRKSVVSRFRPKFLEQRKAGLGQFLNAILLNPEFAGSPVLKEFIFS